MGSEFTAACATKPSDAASRLIEDREVAAFMPDVLNECSDPHFHSKLSMAVKTDPSSSCADSKTRLTSPVEAERFPLKSYSSWLASRF
jgi:hypothetical protein